MLILECFILFNNIFRKLFVKHISELANHGSDPLKLLLHLVVIDVHSFQLSFITFISKVILQILLVSFPCVFKLRLKVFDLLELFIRERQPFVFVLLKKVVLQVLILLQRQEQVFPGGWDHNLVIGVYGDSPLSGYDLEDLLSVRFEIVCDDHYSV